MTLMKHLEERAERAEFERDAARTLTKQNDEVWAAELKRVSDERDALREECAIYQDHLDAEGLKLAHARIDAARSKK